MAVIQCNSVVSGLLGKKNPYDVRLDCEVSQSAINLVTLDQLQTPPMCYNTTSLDAFMNRDDVQTALGVHKKWKECSPLVYALMLGDWVTEWVASLFITSLVIVLFRMRTKVGELLADGMQVLIYSGDQDFICNW